MRASDDFSSVGCAKCSRKWNDLSRSSRHLVNLDSLFATLHLDLAHRGCSSQSFAEVLPDDFRDQKLRAKLLVEFFDTRGQIHDIANHRILSPQCRTNTTCHGLAGMQTNSDRG